VQRIILVGDPTNYTNWTRKVFSDIIDWLRNNHPASIGELTVNLRQMENRLIGKEQNNRLGFSLCKEPKP